MSMETLKEYLKEQDPDALVDILGLTSEEIVDRFEDVIEEKAPKIKDLVE